MKRIFARLLSFALMIVMVISVTGKLSANFSEVYRVIGVAASERNGDWVLYTNRTEDGADREIIRINDMGNLIEGMAKPMGFAISLIIYLVLLFAGRKKAVNSERNDYGEEEIWQVDNHCA